jgi:hypothetical protein
MSEDKVLEVLAALFAGDEPRSHWELAQRLDDICEQFDLSDADCEIVADKLAQQMRRQDIQS